MLWTAPPPARSATDVGAVKAPTIQRSYPCKRPRQSVSTLRSRSSRFTELMLPARWSSAAVEASVRPFVFPEVAAVPGRHRSLRLVAPLVARAASTWSYGTADASGLRQTLCQTAEE